MPQPRDNVVYVHIVEWKFVYKVIILEYKFICSSKSFQESIQ